VLAPLPDGLPTAVIMLQHISPDHPSEPANLLDQRTALTVTAATDGIALAPGSSGHSAGTGRPHRR
jgi:two-component system chemotaxis response regulator CheB